MNLQYLLCCNDSSESRRYCMSDKNDLCHLCHALTDYIIENYELELISQIIFKNMDFFSKYQKKEIYQYIVSKLQTNQEFYRIRYQIIFQKLIEYCSEEHVLVVGGFVVFRLTSYIATLENFVLTQIDEYLVKKDYEEFLSLMRYFVDIAECKCKNVDAYYDGTMFRLFDEYDTELTNQYAQVLSMNYPDIMITQDDAFFSLLISLAPNHITIHDAGSVPNKQLLDTLKKVFGSRICYL